VSVRRTLRERGLSRIGVGVGVLRFVVFGSRTDRALAYVYYGDDGPNTFTGRTSTSSGRTGERRRLRA